MIPFEDEASAEGEENSKLKNTVATVPGTAVLRLTSSIELSVVVVVVRVIEVDSIIETVVESWTDVVLVVLAITDRLRLPCKDVDVRRGVVWGAG